MLHLESRVLAAALTILALLFSVPATAEPSPDCAKTKSDMAKIDKAIAQIEKSQLPGKLASEGKRFLAQMQVDALNTHAHKLQFVGCLSRSDVISPVHFQPQELVHRVHGRVC